MMPIVSMAVVFLLSLTALMICAVLMEKSLTGVFNIPRRPARVISALFVMLLAIGLALGAYHRGLPQLFGETAELFWAKDACFKDGGCWDKVASTCRKNEPNARELCSRS